MAITSILESKLPNPVAQDLSKKPEPLSSPAPAQQEPIKEPVVTPQPDIKPQKITVSEPIIEPQREFEKTPLSVSSSITELPNTQAEVQTEPNFSSIRQRELNLQKIDPIYHINNLNALTDKLQKQASKVLTEGDYYGWAKQQSLNNALVDLHTKATDRLKQIANLPENEQQTKSAILKNKYVAAQNKLLAEHDKLIKGYREKTAMKFRDAINLLEKKHSGDAKATLAKYLSKLAEQYPQEYGSLHEEFKKQLAVIDDMHKHNMMLHEKRANDYYKVELKKHNGDKKAALAGVYDTFRKAHFSRPGYQDLIQKSAEAMKNAVQSTVNNKGERISPSHAILQSAINEHKKRYLKNKEQLAKQYDEKIDRLNRHLEKAGTLSDNLSPYSKELKRLEAEKANALKDLKDRTVTTIQDQVTKYKSTRKVDNNMLKALREPKKQSVKINETVPQINKPTKPDLQPLTKDEELNHKLQDLHRQRKIARANVLLHKGNEKQAQQQLKRIDDNFESKAHDLIKQHHPENWINLKQYLESKNK